MILKALEVNAAARYQTANEMLAALQGKSVASVVATKNCPHCGQPMRATANFCQHCGRSSQPLTFPGLAVTQVRDLATACPQHWPEAIGYLTTGQLEQWLQGQAAAGQHLLQVLQRVRSQYPRDPDLQLDALLRQIDPSLPTPQVQVSPAQPRTLTLEQGESHSATLKITNSGAGVLFVNIVPSEAWIVVKPATVQCAAGQSQSITVILDTASLTGNRSGKHYAAQITFQTNGGDQQATYPIQLTANPKLAVTPQQVDFGNIALGRPQSRQINLQNTGTGLLTVQLNAPDNWLQVTPTTLTLGRQQQQPVTIQIVPQHLDRRGVHSQIVHVHGAGAGDEQVRVSLALTGPVSLSADAGSPLNSIEELIRWCDTHWLAAIQTLRTGELYIAVRYLGEPNRGRLKRRPLEPWPVVLNQVQQANALPNDNIALERALRALGAQPPRYRHNWRTVESQLGLGMRPDRVGSGPGGQVPVRCSFAFRI